MTRLEELEAVVSNPDKWQAWCDIRVLERAESAEARIDVLEAENEKLKRALAELLPLVERSVRLLAVSS
jgi:hypothetical protein